MSDESPTIQRADLESAAQAIAKAGRDELVERLRNAYHDAAAAHADLLAIDEGRLEQMVQHAADRADGSSGAGRLLRSGRSSLGSRSRER